MVWDEILRGLDAEAFREHGTEGRHLHVPETGQRADAPAQVVAVSGIRPHSLCVPVVLVVDHGRELLNPLGHRAGEAVNRRLLPKRLLELAGIGGRDLARIERAEALLQLQRPGEGGLNRHLLVEGEPDQQRQRLLGQERICLLVPGEVQRVRHATILDLRSNRHPG